jgi:hypothetical protein
MSDVKKAIEKAKRLRALYEGATTEGEAQAAAHALGLLLQRYRIKEAELDVDGDDDFRIANAVEGKRVPSWRSRLLMVVAEECGVALVRSKSRNRQRYILCGQDDDVSIALQMYEWLASDVLLLAERNAHGRTGKHSYRLGFVHGIAEQLAAARAQARSEATQKALVKLDRRKQDACRQLEEMTGRKLTRGRARKVSVSESAYSEGFLRGRFHDIRKTNGEPTRSLERGES